ncbi:hypothetical protein ABWL39_10360 [Chitinivorax sp. PXF-14]|uniref:hypothetical protein n=1 Tax=Chitinivorax sp. PXF-14 TaxID=3230488 RepID=UPI00346703D8
MDITSVSALAQLAQPASQAKAGYGFSLADVARFEQAYQGPGKVQEKGLANMMAPLNRIGIEATQFAREIGAITRTGEIAPSQMMMLTMKAHEFMFQCELTANVANRSSDGVQQLFRQQS